MTTHRVTPIRDYLGTLHANVCRLERHLQIFMDATYGKPLSAEVLASDIDSGRIQAIEMQVTQLADQLWDINRGKA